VHCVHHHIYVAREASPARQYNADHGCQGARRLLQQRILVAPSITSIMFLGPHVGAQHLCTCPFSYKRGGTQRNRLKLTQAHLDMHKFIQAQYITQWSRVLRSGGPNHSKSLCVLMSSPFFPTNKQNT
jgi:hypothetical protein